MNGAVVDLWPDPLDCAEHGWETFGIFDFCPDCAIELQAAGERIADQEADEYARELRARWRVL